MSERDAQDVRAEMVSCCVVGRTSAAAHDSGRINITRCGSLCGSLCALRRLEARLIVDAVPPLLGGITVHVSRMVRGTRRHTGGRGARAGPCATTRAQSRTQNAHVALSKSFAIPSQPLPQVTNTNDASRVRFIHTSVVLQVFLRLQSVARGLLVRLVARKQSSRLRGGKGGFDARRQRRI